VPVHLACTEDKPVLQAVGSMLPLEVLGAHGWVVVADIHNFPEVAVASTGLMGTGVHGEVAVDKERKLVRTDSVGLQVVLVVVHSSAVERHLASVLIGDTRSPEGRKAHLAAGRMTGDYLLGSHSGP